MSTNIRVQRICQQCGKEFEARTTVTRTCSDTCANRAYKARQRAAKVEASNEQTRQVIERPVEIIRSKDFLNIADTCKLLGLSRWTVWRSIRAGSLNAVKIGRRTIIRRSDIDRLFEQPAPVLAPVPAVALSDCYTLKEVMQTYPISEKALHELIRRNDIPKQHSGRYAYVPKDRIDALLTPASHDQSSPA